VADVLEVSPFGDAGDCIIAFDGRVLEVFSHFHPISDFDVDSMRVHVKQLSVTVSGPDRKGRRKVRFAGKSRFGFTLANLEDAQWSSLPPLLDALKAAGADFRS
jgi:hypothetical protein